MRRLILLRHAKTERDAPTGHDIDRRLDARGVEDAGVVGRWLAQHNYRPDLVLVSNASRAQETWGIIAASLHPPRVVTLADLYGADAGGLLQIIHAAETTDPKLLMIVAHNPTLHETALGLIGSGDQSGRDALAANLPTAAAAIIAFEIDGWSDARFRSGKLEHFVSPKLLKEWSDND